MNDKMPALVIVTIGLFFSHFCKDSKMPEPPVPAKHAELLPESSIQRLSRQTVFFGHQSVGYNILDGIRDIARDYPSLTLNISETSDPASLRAPMLAHSRIGRNGQPLTKLDDFANLWRRREQSTDVAFMKFCYVDFTDQTDVGDLVRRYADTFAGLRQSSPGTTFIHVTAPLTAPRNVLMTAAKNVIKRLIGRPGANYRPNVKQAEFNDLLRRTYLGKEPVFDLAAIESTRADGTRVMSRESGTAVYSLAPEYTFDGGHLNERGRRIVAFDLLRFLATLPEKAPKN